MMNDIAITSVSSKGQIVIPLDMRKDLKEGEKLIILRTKEHIILKKASTVRKQLTDDLEFAKKTEEAWIEYDKGNFKTQSADDFLSELNRV